MEKYANKELFSRLLLLDGPSLPEKLSFRPLQRNDWSRGVIGEKLQINNRFVEFNTLLNSLSEETFELSKQDFEERFDLMQSASPECYFIVVIENTITKEIIACGTVFIEYKFLKSTSKAAHIEDVVVAKSYRGKNLGKLLIEMLSRIARSKKCYKIVLDCKEHNVEFYKKCNFSVTGVEMKQYI